MADRLSPNMQTGSSDDLHGLPFDADIMFADRMGAYNPRIEKNQLDLAKKLPFLKNVLEDGERLLVITRVLPRIDSLESAATE